MPITYDPADKAVIDLASMVMKRHEPELHQAGVTFQILFARNSDHGPSVKLHGYPCAATIKINSYKDRVKGMPDCTITIDEREWLDANARRRESLLYHEFHHLELVYTRPTKKRPGKSIKKDDAGRPRLKMRLHDHQVGIFTEVIDQFGADSYDHDQIEGIRSYVQTLLPWG